MCWKIILIFQSNSKVWNPNWKKIQFFKDFWAKILKMKLEFPRLLSIFPSYAKVWVEMTVLILKLQLYKFPLFEMNYELVESECWTDTTKYVSWKKLLLPWNSMIAMVPQYFAFSIKLDYYKYVPMKMTAFSMVKFEITNFDIQLIRGDFHWKTNTVYNFTRKKLAHTCT